MKIISFATTLFCLLCIHCQGPEDLYILVNETNDNIIVSMTTSIPLSKFKSLGFKKTSTNKNVFKKDSWTQIPKHELHIDSINNTISLYLKSNDILFLTETRFKDNILRYFNKITVYRSKESIIINNIKPEYRIIELRNDYYSISKYLKRYSSTGGCCLLSFPEIAYGFIIK